MQRVWQREGAGTPRLKIATALQTAKTIGTVDHGGSITRNLPKGETSVVGIFRL